MSSAFTVTRLSCATCRVDALASCSAFATEGVYVLDFFTPLPSPLALRGSCCTADACVHAKKLA